MRVSLTTIKRMIREAVEECYSNMDEDGSSDPIDAGIEELPPGAGTPPTRGSGAEPVPAELRTRHDAPSGELPQRDPRSVVPEAAIRRMVRKIVRESLRSKR